MIYNFHPELPFFVDEKMIERRGGIHGHQAKAIDNKAD